MLKSNFVILTNKTFRDIFNILTFFFFVSHSWGLNPNFQNEFAHYFQMTVVMLSSKKEEKDKNKNVAFLTKSASKMKRHWKNSEIQRYCI